VIFTVVGIDQDHESRSVSAEGASPGTLADDLCRDGWKFAMVYQDGEAVAGVKFSASARRHVPWVVPAPRERGK
jgi:hypothetical protein